MFNGLFMLLALSTLMAIASFLAGSLPLSLSLPPAQLKIVTTLGMGILVGTSLIVIIPEGAETLYSANEVGHTQTRRHLAARGAVAVPMADHNAPRIVARVDTAEELDAIHALPGPALPESLLPDPSKDDPPTTPDGPGVVGALEAPVGPAPEPADPATHHAWMGIALVLGFILMYLIDTLPSLAPPTAPARANIYSLSDLGSSQPGSPHGGSGSGAGAGSWRFLSTPMTLGLVIHAAADGIALGASSTQPALSFIIFFAIMVHKAPAAFGLTSVLLKQGLSKRQARTHLVIFSLAAPAGAVFAWLLIGILGGGGSSSDAAVRATKWWTGVILLFSGGTFLYVAMHTMQDDIGLGDEPHANGYLEVPAHRERGGTAGAKQPKSLRLVLVAVAGMLLPLITQVGHAH